MKKIDKISRLNTQLEYAFRLLNKDFFNDELPTPIITVIPTPKAYAHYTPFPIWDTQDGAKHEINISSETLNRPLENIIASLLHEMVHFYNDVVLNVNDTSRNGTYHNKKFAVQAEKRGLTVTYSSKYGHAHTSPDDSLIEWVLNHDELKEVEICRGSTLNKAIGIGTHSNSGHGAKPTGAKSHHRKYICPHCGNSVRATKQVNIICADCMVHMVEA